MEEADLLGLIESLRATGREWRTVDAKQELILQEAGDKAEFVKDAAAMANNAEPSYLVIGLEDGTFLDTGKLSHHYEKNDLNQILVNRIDPPVVRARFTSAMKTERKESAAQSWRSFYRKGRYERNLKTKACMLNVSC